MSSGGRLALALSVVVLLAFTAPCSAATLQAGFYKGKCGLVDVESVVATVVAAQFARDRSIVAALLRMQFHDCFVNGCDASILLDGSSSEKTAGPNLSVRGYDLIDAVKAAVEAICPGVVSCADIIVMATRDAVALAKGGRYGVQTGRLDGKVSLARNVNLPGPSITVSQAASAFAQKGLTISDMVLLLGGHTVGIAHCSLFQDRLYDFNGLGKPDPTMDPKLVAALRPRCPQSATLDNTVDLDQNPTSALVVDSSYYKQVLARRGVLQIDQELASDRRSKSLVATLANATDFSARFGRAMVKLGALQSRLPGEIRRSCRALNKRR
ncbi:peroxidase 60-like [Rhodamnia argentea]|uniref:Peroxidase n=1 Tax=Rhodamnia argentea TaxID=178133 RepID=A0A8B8NK45_9MYRT|nr:peroxidase 60-like [Rhodamnia argentea]